MFMWISRKHNSVPELLLGSSDAPRYKGEYVSQTLLSYNVAKVGVSLSPLFSTDIMWHNQFLCSTKYLVMYTVITL